MKILYLFLGWLLGILSPIIVDGIRRRRENAEVRGALNTELNELKFVLACGVYRVAMRFGNIDRNLLNWLLPIIEEYKGINPSENILKNIRNQLSLTDEQIKGLSQRGQDEEGQGLSMKKHTVPILDSKFSLVSTFNTRLQNELLGIRAHLNLLNEVVDDARYYFRLSFDGGISDVNRKITEVNMNDCYSNYASKAKFIVNRINQMSW